MEKSKWDVPKTSPKIPDPFKDEETQEPEYVPLKSMKELAAEREKIKYDKNLGDIKDTKTLVGELAKLSLKYWKLKAKPYVKYLVVLRKQFMYAGKNILKFMGFILLLFLIHRAYLYTQMPENQRVVSDSFSDISGKFCDPETPYKWKAQRMDLIKNNYVIWWGDVMEVKDKDKYFELQMKLCRQTISSDITVKFLPEEYPQIKDLHSGDTVRFKAKIKSWDPIKKIKAENGDLLKLVPRTINRY